MENEVQRKLFLKEHAVHEEASKRNKIITTKHI